MLRETSVRNAQMRIARSRPLTVEIILASARPDDSISLAALLADSAWKLIAVDTCKKAVSNIQNARRPVVLLDENLDNQPWQESLRLLLLAHQRACVVLLANPSDGHLFREVTHHGAFDLLMRPIEKGQVFQCLFFAYSRWVTVQPAGSLRPARPVRAREAELAHQ